MKKLFAIGLVVAVALILLPLGSYSPARADATFTVNDTSDVVDVNPGDGVCETAAGNGVCTLRAAIQETNALSGSDTIVLPVGNFTLTGAAGEDAAASGDLDITQNLTINGSSAAGTIIVGSAAPDRVFHILNGPTVTISNVTIRGGSGVTNGGGILLESGTLTLNNSRVGDSSTGNSATNGGGIYQTGGTLTVNFTTITMNSATSGGGIYFAGGTLTINNSTLGPANGATDGAGLYVPSGPSATVNNSTFSGNSASGTGGAVFAAGTVNLNSVTIAANSATTAGGGVYQLGGTVNLRNTLLATNTGGVGPDCSGTVSSQGYNLVGKIDGCNGVFNGVNGDQAGTIASPLDPQISGLADNGGLTKTHALNSGSTAIDAGNPSGCGNGSTFTNEQRGPGFPRSVDGNVDGISRCDIGAYESGPIGNTVTPSMTFTPSNTPTPTITETTAPSDTPTLTPTTGPTAVPTVTPTASPVAGGKLPGTILPVTSVGGVSGGGGVTNLAASQTSAVLATQAAFSPTPSATMSEADMTATDAALTASAPTAIPTSTPIPSITPTFSLPEEDVSLSTARTVGVEGGVVTCGIWFVEVPSATVADNSVFRCETISPEDEAKASLPLNHRAIWHIVDLKAADPGGAALTHFNPPLKICAYYADSQLESVGGDPSRFVIYTADRVSGRWTSLITTAEEGVPRVCAETDRLSLFRLVAQPSPTVTKLVGWTSNPWVIGLLGGGCCLFLLVLIVAVVLVARRRRQPPAEAPAA